MVSIYIFARLVHSGVASSVLTLRVLRALANLYRYCAGQSNMALPLLHTYSRNETRDAIQNGKYANMRIHGLAGNMNVDQPWATLKQALANTTGDDSDKSR